MTTEKFEELQTPIIKQLEKDGDSYLLVCFSKEHLEYTGLHEGLTKNHVITIVNKLSEYFKTNKP